MPELVDTETSSGVHPVTVVTLTGSCEAVRMPRFELPVSGHPPANHAVGRDRASVCLPSRGRPGPRPRTHR